MNTESPATISAPHDGTGYVEPARDWAEILARKTAHSLPICDLGSAKAINAVAAAMRSIAPEMTAEIERLKQEFRARSADDGRLFDLYKSRGVDLATAQAEITRLRATQANLVEALNWYANEAAWTIDQIEGPDGDYGTRARNALDAAKEG